MQIKTHSRSQTIPVLFEDDISIVFDKPPGLLVIPTPKNERKTLVRIVNEQYAKKGVSEKLHPCHRLDRETSGVILFAKGKKSQKDLRALFAEKKIHKTYSAFIQGVPKNQSGVFKDFIKDIDDKKFRKGSPYKKAETQYSVTQKRDNFCVVEVVTLTGRTNQIRIQFAKYGHPLIGDRKYSVVKKYPLRFKRTALHASTLEWKSLLDNKLIKVKAPLPLDMDSFLEKNY